MMRSVRRFVVRLAARRRDREPGFARGGQPGIHSNAHVGYRMSRRRTRYDRLFHLEHLDRLGFDLRPQQRMKPLARRKVGRTAEDIGESLAQPDQLDEPEATRAVV